ncbi:MAG: hypothetical protein SO177_02095 [Streptococcus thoraltensis]|uniref:hypothetical protein n=1 Tax=Streptococcus thoraltensis TaxID=55085 RepID=UPI0003766F01|nr:hypothetical protein [Streptococcus thoraltensis]MDY4760837.1 hypothetical protein [Streptococcus thoraltensis]
MKHGRQTRFEERIEIVNVTISHHKDYWTEIERYGTSYHWVYSWVRKFEKEKRTVKG